MYSTPANPFKYDHKPKNFTVMAYIPAMDKMLHWALWRFNASLPIRPVVSRNGLIAV